MEKKNKFLLIIAFLSIFLLSFSVYSQTNNNYHLTCENTNNFKSYYNCAYLDNMINSNNKLYDLEVIKNYGVKNNLLKNG